ncbi:MAG: hypothetical protein ACFBRM_09980 [Pikeienuella sp.]
MPTHPSLVTRIAVAKFIGLAIGLVAFLAAPLIAPDIGLAMRLGLLFWYATVGAMIGLAGVFIEHPVLGFAMPWFVRGPLVAGWMNLNLALIAHGALMPLLVPILGPVGLSTFLILAVIEGLIVGALIGWAATRLGGEGPATLAR